MSEFENAFARSGPADLPRVMSKGSYRTLLELAARGSDRELAGFMRSVVRAAIDHGLKPEETQLFEAPGPQLCVHLLPAPLGAPPEAGEASGEELLLFVLPQPEVSEAQVARLAEQLELDAPDARQALRCPVPRVLAKGRASEIRPKAAALDAAGLRLGCLELESLLDELEPWVVEWIDVDDDALYLNGAEGRVPLRLGDEALLVRGRYAWFPSALSPAAGTAAMRRGASTALPRMSLSPFAHLYLAGSPRPYSFVESELRDYAFLREDMAPSAHANFQALLGILGSAPQVRVDTTLEEVEPLVVQRAAGALWQGTAPPDSSSPDLDAEVLSRLLYYTTF